ncbi:MAG: CoA transferase [Chloroflexi bacterium CFX7]|nr:CoA transferase [Chloroflexi bacterium CFX7]RIL01729.1 MAG: carnitine dehydratase [bacterium]
MLAGRVESALVTTLPLQGIRVCDLTWIIAGPTATRFLADFGAEVIRVEHGQAVDSIRLGRPIAGDSPTLNNSGFFNYFNRNKKSILLNVRHPGGMEVLKRLIAASDVVVENFSSGVMTSWGLDYPDLKAIKEDIIYCSLSGFGHSGRDRDFVTWGPTAQALCGLTFMSGLPGKPPAGWGYSYMDHTAGYYAAIGIMMALHHRNRTGKGQHIDLSQVEAGIVLTGPSILDKTVNGRSARREGMPPGNRAWEPAVAPHNTYACAGEDRWLAVAVMNDAEWLAMVRAMDSPDWALDERFATNAGRLAHQDELDARIETWTSEFEDYEAMQILQAAGVRAGVCQAPSDRATRDPQLASRDWWHTLPHAEMGECEFDGVVPKLSLTPGTLRTASPLIGEHTHAVMAEVLGMSADEIAEHEAAGVFM